MKLDIENIERSVYVILGIDSNAHDQVISVCKSYEDAKRYCTKYLMQTDFHDLWIEKHPVL